MSLPQEFLDTYKELVDFPIYFLSGVTCIFQYTKVQLYLDNM